jgi:thioesterase domain-containing protein
MHKPDLLKTKAMNSLVDYLRQNVALSRHIDIAAGELNQEWFELTAPLLANLNDKQTAFGGSLATLCTLAGWCITSYLCKAINNKIDIAVLDRQIRYRLPVISDPIAARGYFPDQVVMDDFIRILQSNGTARLKLDVQILDEQKPAVIFSGQYYARIL